MCYSNDLLHNGHDENNSGGDRFLSMTFMHPSLKRLLTGKSSGIATKTFIASNFGEVSKLNYTVGTFHPFFH
jgi:hypothetical protein